MDKNQQTRSYLMKKFETIGIRPRAKLGQNFLIDLNLLRLLHESANLEKSDVVLEVGTGTGALTAELSDRAAWVITVELDSVLHELAKQELYGRTNIRFLQADILKNKNKLSDDVLTAVREQLSQIPGGRFKLVANLPYNIATPLMSNLLLTDIPPYSMTVTIQKELADRITAEPGTRDWGALSLWMQSQCQTELIRVMPPSVFWPRPKVNSAILRITYDARRRKKIPDLKFFHEFCRAMFFHRRKFLRSELCSAFKYTLSKETVDQIMLDMGFDEKTRAETLDLQTMLQLCERCRKELAHLPEKERKIL